MMQSNFLIKLKEQTDNLHKKAHHVEYFKSVMKHTLTKECYIGQLRTLAIIYGALESNIQRSNLPFPKCIKDFKWYDNL